MTIAEWIYGEPGGVYPRLSQGISFCAVASDALEV